MNYYKQIAEMLGVELGEEFKVSDMENFTFKFTEGGGLMFRYGKDEDFYLSTELAKLLRGDCSVVKLPWKPKEGEQYFYCSILGKSIVVSTNWACFNSDLCRWKCGNCFRTKEEARTKGKEIMEQIKKEYEEA